MNPLDDRAMEPSGSAEHKPRRRLDTAQIEKKHPIAFPSRQKVNTGVPVPTAAGLGAATD
jgi:hypothetical protein